MPFDQAHSQNGEDVSHILYMIPSTKYLDEGQGDKIQVEITDMTRDIKERDVQSDVFLSVRNEQPSQRSKSYKMNTQGVTLYDAPVPKQKKRLKDTISKFFLKILFLKQK